MPVEILGYVMPSEPDPDDVEDPLAYNEPINIPDVPPEALAGETPQVSPEAPQMEVPYAPPTRQEVLDFHRRAKLDLAELFPQPQPGEGIGFSGELLYGLTNAYLKGGREGARQYAQAAAQGLMEIPTKIWERVSAVFKPSQWEEHPVRTLHDAALMATMVYGHKGDIAKVGHRIMYKQIPGRAVPRAEIRTIVQRAIQNKLNAGEALTDAEKAYLNLGKGKQAKVARGQEELRTEGTEVPRFGRRPRATPPVEEPVTQPPMEEPRAPSIIETPAPAAEPVEFMYAIKVGDEVYAGKGYGEILDRVPKKKAGMIMEPGFLGKGGQFVTDLDVGKLQDEGANVQIRAPKREKRIYKRTIKVPEEGRGYEFSFFDADSKQVISGKGVLAGESERVWAFRTEEDKTVLVPKRALQKLKLADVKLPEPKPIQKFGPGRKGVEWEQAAEGEKPETDYYMNTHDIASELKVHPEHVQDLVRAGAIRGEKKGTTYRVLRSDFMRFVNGEPPLPKAPPTEAPTAKVPQEGRRSIGEWEEEFSKLIAKVKRAEKTPGRRMSDAEVDLMTKDWKAYSKARGYSPQEIADFERFQQLVGEGLDLGLTMDEIQGIDYDVSSKLDKTILRKKTVEAPKVEAPPVEEVGTTSIKKRMGELKDLIESAVVAGGDPDEVKMWVEEYKQLKKGLAEEDLPHPETFKGRDVSDFVRKETSKSIATRTGKRVTTDEFEAKKQARRVEQELNLEPGTIDFYTDLAETIRLSSDKEGTIKFLSKKFSVSPKFLRKLADMATVLNNERGSIVFDPRTMKKWGSMFFKPKPSVKDLQSIVPDFLRDIKDQTSPEYYNSIKDVPIFMNPYRSYYSGIKYTPGKGGMKPEDLCLLNELGKLEEFVDSLGIIKKVLLISSGPEVVAHEGMHGHQETTPEDVRRPQVQAVRKLIRAKPGYFGLYIYRFWQNYFSKVRTFGITPEMLGGEFVCFYESGREAGLDAASLDFFANEVIADFADTTAIRSKITPVEAEELLNDPVAVEAIEELDRYLHGSAPHQPTLEVLSEIAGHVKHMDPQIVEVIRKELRDINAAARERGKKYMESPETKAERIRNDILKKAKLLGESETSREFTPKRVYNAIKEYGFTRDWTVYEGVTVFKNEEDPSVRVTVRKDDGVTLISKKQADGEYKPVAMCQDWTSLAKGLSDVGFMTRAEAVRGTEHLVQKINIYEMRKKHEFRGVEDLDTAEGWARGLGHDRWQALSHALGVYFEGDKDPFIVGIKKPIDKNGNITINGVWSIIDWIGRARNSLGSWDRRAAEYLDQVDWFKILDMPHNKGRPGNAPAYFPKTSEFMGDVPEAEPERLALPEPDVVEAEVVEKPTVGIEGKTDRELMDRWYEVSDTPEGREIEAELRKRNLWAAKTEIPHPETGGAISEFQGDYRFLSNFWPAKVYFEGEEYPTVEHAYQAAKTVDKEARDKIRKAGTPGKAKRMQKTLREDWEDVKLDVMRFLVREKFKNNRRLAQQLLDTGDRYLQEGNRWGDTFWGVDLRTGKGENNLGKILSDVRNELRGAEETELPHPETGGGGKKPPEDKPLSYREVYIMQSNPEYIYWPGLLEHLSKYTGRLTGERFGDMVPVPGAVGVTEEAMRGTDVTGRPLPMLEYEEPDVPGKATLSEERRNEYAAIAKEEQQDTLDKALEWLIPSIEEYKHGKLEYKTTRPLDLEEQPKLPELRRLAKRFNLKVGDEDFLRTLRALHSTRHHAGDLDDFVEAEEIRFVLAQRVWNTLSSVDKKRMLPIAAQEMGAGLLEDYRFEGRDPENLAMNIFINTVKDYWSGGFAYVEVAELADRFLNRVRGIRKKEATEKKSIIAKRRALIRGER